MECDVIKFSCLSDRFEKSFHVNIEGKTYFEPDYDPNLEKFYRTFYGPYVGHNGVIWADSGPGLNKAIVRLTSTTHSTVELERIYTQAQRYHFKHNIYLLDIQRQIRENFMKSIQNVGCIEEFESYIHRPHPKRKMRVAAYERLINDGLLGHDTFVNLVTGKLKLHEWAKPGKIPRLINDFTVVGSLLGGFVAEKLKYAMAEQSYSVAGLRTQFVMSPNISKLEEAFDRLLFPEYDVEFVYFSDDSCVSLKGDFLAYNVDISSADRSAHTAVFMFILGCIDDNTCFKLFMARTIKQCLLPLKLKRGYQKKLLKPLEFTLYTGSVLTTLINNAANIAIATCIYCNRSITIPAAVLRAGYIVTCDKANVPEDIQFLKHSPAVTRSGVKVWLNFGVILRCIGNCKGDLPGKSSTPISVRGHIFNSNLVTALKHAGNSRLLRMLQVKFDSDLHVDVSTHLPYFLVDGVNLEPILDDVVCNRYKCSQWEYDEFLYEFSNAKPFSCVRNSFSRKVMNLDYGL